MSQAVVDPGELRRFAGMLKRFHSDLQTALTQVHAQMIALGDTWRDQEHAHFAEEFEQTSKVLERFLSVTEEHVPFLLRKAEKVEDYLQQR